MNPTSAPSAAAPHAGVPPEYGPPLGLAAAKRVAAAAEAKAAELGFPVVIAVVDSAGHLVLLQRLDQANLGALELALRKAETAVRFRRPTKSFEEIIAAGGVRLLSIADAVITLEGGLPLLSSGRVVGAIGVSGMTSAEDGLVANAGAAAL